MDHSTLPFQVGAANRPHRHETVSGDAWAVHFGPDKLRVALVDGAGHGEQARIASDAALGELAKRADRGPVAEIRDCHAALQRTRGGVLAVAHFSYSGGRLEVAGVGNIDLVLIQDGRENHLVTQRGMLGYTMPTVRSVVVDLPTDWALVMHSDGIRGRFSLQQPELQSGLAQSPQVLAEMILQDFHRADDDATVLVIVPSRPA